VIKMVKYHDRKGGEKGKTDRITWGCPNKQGGINMDDGKSVGFVFGLLVGALVGASVAVLLAPQSGEETREILREKAVEARRRAKEFSDDFRDDAEEWMEKGKKYIEETKTHFKKPEKSEHEVPAPSEA
jgi:gas vesicle protein